MSSLPAEKEANVDQQVERVTGVSSIKSSEVDGKDAANEDLVYAEQLAAQWVEGTAEEKQLVRKLDWRILPCTWILYLLGYLDRANIGYVYA
jgi:hypothetical protein